MQNSVFWCIFRRIKVLLFVIPYINISVSSKNALKTYTNIYVYTHIFSQLSIFDAINSKLVIQLFIHMCED
eukprot:snap_masked-scaffold_4-processed-gene-20.7-mRNA-1 protein AED:1.00 eAED:1.00 QI:0/0/0/0/1/1/2/0/70